MALLHSANQSLSRSRSRSRSRWPVNGYARDQVESLQEQAQQDDDVAVAAAREPPNIQRLAAIKKGLQPMSTYGLVMGFLSFAERDGYVTKEEREELVEAVDELTGPRGPHINILGSTAEALLKQDRRASEMLEPMGLLRKHEHKGLKNRGTEEVQVDPCLQSGEDARVTLQNRALNCQERGSIREDAALIVYGFSHPANYLGRYRIEVAKLDAWLHAVASQYKNNPYHNWTHAFDVFQLSYLMLTDGGMSKYFNYQDACSILIAAIAHDVGHPGTSNPFQIKAQTQLALVYNDQAPLENMHASLTFDSMRKPGADFLSQLPREDFDNVRMKIIDAILATDMSHHFQFVEKLAARSEQVDTNPFQKLDDVSPDDQASNKKDRGLLLQGIVHMADIGNPFRPWDVYKNLVVSLEEEFFLQGDKERELGIAITPMMDRRADSLAAGQGFFLGKIVAPLFMLYTPFLDTSLHHFCRDNLESNQRRWQELVDRHGKLSAGTLLAKQLCEK